MNHERTYNENDNHRDYGVGAECDNNDNNNNDNNNDNNNNNDINNDNNNDNNIEMNSVDSWRLRTLYTDTKYVCAAKTDEILTCDKLFAHQNRAPAHPSSLPVILKDSSRPYTYYTAKSYGNAQEKNYYVNFDDHVSGSAAATPDYHYNGSNNNSFDTESDSSVTFENTGCVKTYLCTILGCFVCCLCYLKPV